MFRKDGILKYHPSLIHMTKELAAAEDMYSVVLLRARALTITLGGVTCFLDGAYLLCLGADDTLTVGRGTYEASALRFLPAFYNVNLTASLIDTPLYEDMRTRYGYPDFHLFRDRKEGFLGILPLSDEEYENTRLHFLCAGQHIDSHASDRLWSCRARSDMISILRIAEGVYWGDASGEGSEIVRYIREHLDREITLQGLCLRFNTNRTSLTQEMKRLTGMAPMQYVQLERLNQSRPDLLFTGLSIGEVAQKYGFSSENYYIRAFKKQFGKTPLQYRRDGVAERIRNQEKYRALSKK